jgi:diguanylate cyclase
LCLEITEGVVVLDFETTRNALTGLKDVGVYVAIDNFGTGFNGFTHLKSLPIDIVKIDRKIIRDLAIDAGDLAIVRAIMALADAFALEVVTEGVETAAVARTLLGLGCRRAQGFLLSRPLDDATMASLLAKRFMPVQLEGA